MTFPRLTPKLAPFGTSIFAEMSALAVATNSINLGQGFPDVDGPDVVAEAAVEAIRTGKGNQYPPGPGIEELRHAIADHQRAYYGIELDPDAEVLVTCGATEGLASVLLSFLDAGDEAILFEPFYDSYAPCVALAGATVVPITLHAPAFDIDLEAVRRAITARTRLILLNSPHNPTGTVFSVAALRGLAALAIEHDLLVVSDEAYEHLTYDGVAHVPISTLPGMFERTLTVGSAAKTLSFTGWKVGWVTGPAELVAGVRRSKQFLTYVSSGPFQYAVAVGLARPRSDVEAFAADLGRRREILLAGLGRAGFTTFRPSGTYFVTADVSSVTSMSGIELCRQLPARCGVVAIPNEVFYARPEHGRSLVRFAFCKRDEVLVEAVDRLRTLTF
jgi:N-succinyldiaminopimelate aminotransferase